MTDTKRRVLVVQAAGLGYDFLTRYAGSGLAGLTFQPLETVFPAVTCPVQAGFRTSSSVSQHGMVGNGFLFRELMRPLFWEQSSRLVSGGRFWRDFRQGGGTVGILFWQQSLGEDVDVLISPAPIHKHHGGMIQSCYSRPQHLYDRLRDRVGRSFDLKHYWGPLASAASSAWIASATAALLEMPEAPDLCLSYLPVLDYDLQRHGPDSPQARKALDCLAGQLGELRAAADRAGYEVVVFGDYEIAPVTAGAALPNLALSRAGLFHTRRVQGRLYPDFHAGGACAIVDHEVAHVYADSPKTRDAAAEILRQEAGVGTVLGAREQHDLGIDHGRSGDLVLVAADGGWFAYPWWQAAREAPDYAKHVDIHSKPGYDPCELFWGIPPFSVSQRLDRVRGSHGKAGSARRVAWASTVPFAEQPGSVLDLSAALAEWLGAA